MLAASIHAINLGLSIITKEHMQNTADFLMTKPYSRKQIFLSKMAAALCAIFIIAIAYCIGGVVAMLIVTGGGFDYTIFTLLSLVFPLLQVLFLLIGVLIGYNHFKGWLYITACAGGVLLDFMLQGCFQMSLIVILQGGFHRSDI